MKKDELFNKIKGKLIVSCQALKNEPLFGSDVMAKMALAAEMGGVGGIRANGTNDIIAIKQMTDLPIIGLLKRTYQDSDIYITPTKKEIDELMEVGVDMIAIDATDRKRPNGEKIEELIQYMKEQEQLILADISTIKEGLTVLEAGADCISTTLSGYTTYTQRVSDGPDVTLLSRLCEETDRPVIAEGRVRYPKEARLLIKKGAHAVVVGSAITRPQFITQSFTEALIGDGN